MRRRDAEAEIVAVTGQINELFDDLEQIVSALNAILINPPTHLQGD